MFGFFKRLESLQTITDGRGRLVVMEKLPFPIKRVYFLRDIKEGETRGGHAHKAVRRLMVAVNGSFAVTLRDKRGFHDFTMDNPSKGLFIEPMTWVELKDFSSDAVCLVLASEEYDEADCIRDYTEFARARRAA